MCAGCSVLTEVEDRPTAADVSGETVAERIAARHGIEAPRVSGLDPWEVLEDGRMRGEVRV